MSNSNITAIAAALVVSGKSRTEKRESVLAIEGVSGAGVAYAVGAPGRVGRTARDRVAGGSHAAIAADFVGGRYRSFADAIALTFAESVVITDRRDAEAFVIAYRSRARTALQDLRGGGYGKSGKPSGERITLERFAALCAEIESASIKAAAEVAARKALAAAAKKQAKETDGAAPITE